MTPILVVLLLAGLETKHFLADYVLQNSWIIRGKGDLRAGGGYVHAGLHVLGSLIVLLFFHLPVALLAQMLVAEFVIHYAIDFTKATTGRVISAAAAIMICVFLAFVLGGERIIAEFGIGLAAAVFLDAAIIRTVLVPSLMHLFGRRNWWLPAVIDRHLPHLSVEPVEKPESQPVSGSASPASVAPEA